MVRTTYSRTLRRPFALTIDEIQSLYKALSFEHHRPKISADCSDDSKRTFDGIEEFLDYNNPNNRKITRLRISNRILHNEIGNSESFEIDFSSESYLLQRFGIDRSEIRLNLDGTDEKINALRDKILDMIDGSRPWYYFGARLNFLQLWIGIWLFFIPISIIIAGRYFQQDLEEDSVKTIVMELRRVVYSAFLAYVLGKLLFKLRQHLFPSGVFLTGQQQKFEENRDKVRWRLIWFLVLSVGSVLFAVVKIGWTWLLQ